MRVDRGQESVHLSPNLTEPGFYKYDVQVDAPGDTIPQNNHATAFATVRGNPRVLIVSSDPQRGQARWPRPCKRGKLDVKHDG